MSQGLKNISHIWQVGAEANRIHQIKTLPGLGPYVDAIVAEALNRLSLVLSPKLDPATRSVLIETAHDSILRNFGKRMSLTALLHCFDLVINAQSPFDREMYRFEVRTLNAMLHQYLAEQAEKMRLDEDKPLGSAQRQYLLAKAMAKNPEVNKQLMQLAERLEAKHGLDKGIEYRKAARVNYINLADYLYRNGFEVDEAHSKISAYCRKEDLDFVQTCERMLAEVNGLGKSDELNVALGLTQYKTATSSEISKIPM